MGWSFKKKKKEPSYHKRINYLPDTLKYFRKEKGIFFVLYIKKCDCMKRMTHYIFTFYYFPVESGL